MNSNDKTQSAPERSGKLADVMPLTVRECAMLESNGKSNFTAILVRKDSEGLDRFDGFTIARSEYPDRVRYEADCVRHLIGELAEKPFILDYDADKHSGYVEPEAASSSAAPSDRSINTIEFQRMVGDLMGCRWKVLPTNVEKLIDYIDQHIARLAAPSPTRESLSDADLLKIAAENDYGDEDPKCILRLLRAALATPRQTEDGSGLSAASVHAILVKHLGWVGGPDWTDEAQAICTDLASTFATKETSVQGGVPEGFVLMPKSPSEAVLQPDGWPRLEYARYQAMLSAAPTGASK